MERPISARGRLGADWALCCSGGCRCTYLLHGMRRLNSLREHPDNHWNPGVVAGATSGPGDSMLRITHCSVCVFGLVPGVPIVQQRLFAAHKWLERLRGPRTQRTTFMGGSVFFCSHSLVGGLLRILGVSLLYCIGPAYGYMISACVAIWYKTIWARDRGRNMVAERKEPSLQGSPIHRKATRRRRLTNRG